MNDHDPAKTTPTPTPPPPPPPTTMPPTAAHAAATHAHGGNVIHHSEMPEEHPERHEHTDVSVRGIWITVGAILIVTALVHVLLYVVFFAYEGAQAERDEGERRSAITGVDQGPPAEIPRLQGIQSFNAETPSADNVRMELENRALVNRWGTTPDGKVRMPISRAMEITLERNMFPARAATTQGAAMPGASTQPGGANAPH